MISKTYLLLAWLLVASIPCIESASCPTYSNDGNIHAGRLIAAFNGGVISLTEDQDSQCYNYSLPYALSKQPEVAISVTDFEVDPSTSLFFFVKPIKDDSLSFVPFVIRAQWSYTTWTQITFNFIAEDRNDLQSGYYQIDSGSLAGCSMSKNIEVLLPFRNVFAPSPEIKHNLFLHGFEIYTVKVSQNARSPFEIQLGESRTNTSGIIVQISVTTVTQVNSIYISYLAYQNPQFKYQAGRFVYDATFGVGGGLSYSPDAQIPRNYARLYGMTGFIINYSFSKISYATIWDSFTFTYKFTTTVTVQYYSFQFVFFTGSECDNCPGYYLSYNGTCVSFCPVGTFQTPEKFCLSCGEGRSWNGTACVVSCPSGQYLNTITNKCECPPSLNWNGELCVSCTNGKIFYNETKSCDCPKPLLWNGFACARIQPCTGGKFWDVYTFSCVCIETQYWNGTLCVDIPICRSGQVLDKNYNCTCPENYIWIGSSCAYTPCFGGQVWTGSVCTCPAGLFFNGSMCIECINGQKWNSLKKICECESGYEWTGQYCNKTFKCTGNRVWNQQYQICICDSSFYWSGYACLQVPPCSGGQVWDTTIQKCACLTDYKWDGVSCQLCTFGQIWDSLSLKCACPPGAIQKGNRCQVQQQCSGGKMWMDNLYECQCPDSTVWNGNYCIVNPCTNGRIWNDQYKSCQCSGTKVWIQDSCVPPQISCSNGKVWNPAIYACECPAGTYSAVYRCEAIPNCTNNKVYNPLTNLCDCPFGLVEKSYQCVNPNCPTGQYWNGYQCHVISCPPPSYFAKDRCVYGGADQCDFGYIWNGNTCIYYPATCPIGTTWSGLNCVSNGACGNGFYMDSAGRCQILPQQCPPSTTWNGNSCIGQGNSCPIGTYLSSNKCLPTTPCSNGRFWDATFLVCRCPEGTFTNGDACIQCTSGMEYKPGYGCICPNGKFDTGSTCQPINQQRCDIIPNAIMKDNVCQCRPGFTKVGFQCVCYGTQIGTFCDKCSYKPNSELNVTSNMCMCKTGYTEIKGTCVPFGASIGTNDPKSCSVSTYFDTNHKMCLACPSGCLSCFDCYRCKLCRPEFIYEPTSEQCIQHCGDGRKFTVECDDGNNKDGDGCSRDCKIEAGFSCAGGSPDTPDGCFSFNPTKLVIEQTGQIRMKTSIVLNVKLNYVPKSLLTSAECGENCKSILSASITSGDQSAISIVSKYIAGTQYSFTVTVEFGRTYIGTFNIKIGLNQALGGKYYGNINTTQTLDVLVNPAYLSAVGDNDLLR